MSLTATPDTPETPACMMVALHVMGKIHEIMKSRNITRDELAERLSARRGRQVHVTTIDAWFAAAKPWHWPDATELYLICEHLQTFEPFNEYVHHFSGLVIGPRDQELLKVGKLFMERKRLEFSEADLERAITRFLVEDLRNGKH